MQKSIRQDLSLRIGVVILCISIAVGIFFYFFSIQYHEKKFRQTIEKQTKYFSDTFTLQLWLFDLNTTRKLCKLISESAEVSGLRLFNHKKEIVFEQKPLSKKATVFVNRELRYKGEKIVGYLEICYTDTSWKEHRKNIFTILILIIIGTIVGTFFVVNILLNRYLSIPLENLQKNMVLLEQGDFSQSGLVEQKTEIQTIIDTFNNLAISLQEKDDEVTKKTRALEIEILERKQTEKELLESEKNLISIYNAAENVAFVVTDLAGEDTKILDISPGTEKIFGYSHNEVIGERVAIFHTQDFVKDFPKMLAELSENKEKYSGEVVLVRKSGEHFPALFTVYPKLDDSGKVVGTIGVAIDISKRKQFELKLQQAQKMESIGTLAGGIAHDFNNILFPIVGHTEMLREDISEDSPLRFSLDEIYTAALRARDLVKQILTFSRQESNEVKLMKMQPVIKETLKLIRSTIPTTIEIKQNIQKECGVIKADPTQIHQIIINLSTNAYHSMEEKGGKLEVGLKEIKLSEHDVIKIEMIPGNYACLTIADTGKGMNKELIKKIFDPFFTTKEKGKGTGMGLSVVHGIVKSMGGAIQVYSEPGKGTEFKVYFPVEKSFLEQQSLHINETIQGGVEQILLIDDEEAILKMERIMLERLGYQVTSCTSSIDALEVFSTNPDKFDLVITDMAMPNMSGDQLSAKLVKIRSDIPVLLCTGFSESMSEEKAVSIGIKAFLLKPIVRKDLARKVREVLDKNYNRRKHHEDL